MRIKRAIEKMREDARAFYGEGVDLVLCLRCLGIFERPPDHPPGEPARICEACLSETSTSS